MRDRCRDMAVSLVVVGVALGAVSMARAQDLDLGRGGRAPGPDTSVSSDGTVEQAPDWSRSAEHEPPFEGTGEALPESDRVVESAEDVWRLWDLQAPKKGGVVDTEQIIGADTRFLVSPTTGVWPARAVVLITFEGGRCSGWMAGWDLVVTAGHCVNRGLGRGWYNRASYRVYPGRDGTLSPYGSCTAKRLYSVTGWYRDGNEQYDYGAVKLNCSIGNTTGWFGYWYQSESLYAHATQVNGYPGDKPLTQWASMDSVRVSQTHQVFYSNDTVSGMSGGPVWRYKQGCDACVMGIHTYGLHGSFPHNTHNHAKRITSATFNNIVNWRNAP